MSSVQFSNTTSGASAATAAKLAGELAAAAKSDQISRQKEVQKKKVQAPLKDQGIDPVFADAEMPDLEQINTLPEENETVEESNPAATEESLIQAMSQNLQESIAQLNQVAIHLKNSAQSFKGKDPKLGMEELHQAFINAKLCKEQIEASLNKIV